MSVIYVVNCRALLDADKLNTALPRLSESRRQKTLCLIQPQKRAQSAAAGLLTSHLLSGAEIAYNDAGQPIVVNAANLYISISHTDDWVFCAISDSHIGIDAQVLSAYKQGVADHLFSASERRMKTDEDFTRIWTHKEAYYKLQGNISLAEIANTDFSHTLQYDTLTDCYYRHFVFKKTIHLTACVKQEDTLPNEIVELSIDDI